MMDNFFLERYRYRPLLERMERVGKEERTPIILYRTGGTGTDKPLMRLGIPILSRQTWSAERFEPLAAALAPLDRANVLTIYPVRFVEEMLRAMPDRRLTRINPEWDYHNLYLVEKRPGSG